ncbi:hypothetical protein [Serratia quinivorans]
MKTLIRIHHTLEFDLYPLFIVEAIDEVAMEEALKRNFITYTGYDESVVTVDDDGTYWHGGAFWSVEETNHISDEQAEHLTQILGLSTFS